MLILTCTLVSFFHGSNDGQKGMGLIMLILIGVAPTAYALNRAPAEGHAAAFVASAHAASKIVEAHAAGFAVIGDPRPAVTEYVHAHTIAEGTYPALAVLTKQISDSVEQYGSRRQDAARQGAEPSQRHVSRLGGLPRPGQGQGKRAVAPTTRRSSRAFKKELDWATKFIPLWVKICVAIALGLGTMVGWKRIVITVGEKIGKTHLTYGQGAAAEIVAAATIGAADGFGLPVSTTHVLSSGVAGTMVANGSGMQWSTLRSIALGLGADPAGGDAAVRHAVLRSSAICSDASGGVQRAFRPRRPARPTLQPPPKRPNGFAAQRGRCCVAPRFARSRSLT